jgi:dTDP-4-dehydrorhamnose reductase
MRVLVLGATGMLGTCLVPVLRALGHDVFAHGHTGTASVSVDLRCRDEALHAVTSLAPDVVVNLVGLTDVDRCQQEPQLAWDLNVRTSQNAAAGCVAAGAHLIYISTDHVYDGEGPHKEFDARPGNCYAQTKCAAELAALNVPATVLRTNFFGASQHATRRSFTDWLFDGLQQERRIPVFSDVWFSPLSMSTASRMIERVAVLRPRGVFNLGSREGMTKADFAATFARALGFSGRTLDPTGVDEAALKAWRPRDMRMDNGSIEAVLGQLQPTLAQEIDLVAKDYRAKL